MTTEKKKTGELIDISLGSPKKKFRINGDNTKIIELNPSDVNIVSRLNDAYGQLTEMAQKAGTLLNEEEDANTEEELKKLSSALTKLDEDMRALVDKLFDSPVSAAVADGINMYSPYDGEFWFEHVIEVLSGLYENSFKDEFKKMNDRIHKRTNKYTGKL